MRPSANSRSSADSPVHRDEGNEPLVAVLKSADWGRSAGPRGQLPYRIDELRGHGYRLGWSDVTFRRTPRVRRVADRVEAATVPFLQALSARRLRRGASATLAIFESEGHGLALFRRLTGRRRPPLLVVSCWLGDLARSGGAGRRRLYRFLYGGVDAVTVFSENQRATLGDLLGIPSERVHFVRFGVDHEELHAIEPAEDGYVIAAGRDLGRDWPTLVGAAAGSGWRVELLTRPSQVADLELPPEVELRGHLPRGEYLEVLARASVVVLPTTVREYPTGQSVLLEAMAMGKACVVTDTPAMREYVRDGETALLVPLGDPGALRAAVDRLLADEALRSRIGRRARDVEDSHGGAAQMWASIASVLDEITGPAEPARE